MRSLLIILVSFVVAVPASALTPAQLDFFAENNIIFYDPNGEDCSTTNFTSKPTGDQITWIGDSYSTGAKLVIESKFPGVDFGGTPSNIQGSKRFSYDIDDGAALTTNGNIDSDNPSGVTILKNLADNNALRQYIVFALGTNDQGLSTDAFSGFIDEVVSVAGSTRTIILMTPRTRDYTYGTVVDAVKASSKKHSNIIVADWESAVTKDIDKYFDASDTIHPNSTGYQLFVDTIYNALPGGSVSLLGGNNNAEKVWNYFASASISGVSGNPAAIAGIIGNLQAESSADINPFIVSSSGYYGIFQTTDVGLQDAIAAAGLSSYWGQSNVPQDANDAALQIELDYLMNTFAHTSWFLNNLDKVSNNGGEAGARSYAELFLVAVERAVNGSSPLQDSVVQNFVNNNLYPNNPEYHNKPYQGTAKRRDHASEIYKKFAGSSATTISGATKSSGTASWDNGWLSDNSIPGITKEDAQNVSLSESVKPIGGYHTEDGKPNKILLHNTEGTQNGLAAYPAGNKFPAHFTVDLKKKQGYQHFSIYQPSLAIKGDENGPIQIEIVGFSSSGWTEHDYYLESFTADEWDYLAVLLIAIAGEAGIPLTSSADWSNGVQHVDDFLNYEGILGHMHAPGNDHSDPGNIWPMVSEAIARNPDGAKFASGGNSVCGVEYYGGLKSGGMNMAEAEAFMKEYIDLQTKYASDTRRGTITVSVGDGEATMYFSGCSGGPLSNCTTFVNYFISRHTTGAYASNNGSQMVKSLLDTGTYVDGGTTPRAYAVFSTPSGTTMCGNVKCGHTGVVLGIDEANNKIIIGEAGCGSSASWTGAHEKDLDKFVNGSYTYAYTDEVLKGL